MRNYETPEINRIDDMVEGIYACSGNRPPSDYHDECPFSFDIDFMDFNCGSYSSIRFLGHSVNVCKLSRIVINFFLPMGVNHNFLDLGYMSHCELMGNSGCVSRAQVKCNDRNTFQAILDMNGQNSSESVEFKFVTQWDHDYIDNKNNNYTHGSYNGLTNDNCHGIRDVRSYGAVFISTEVR